MIQRTNYVPVDFRHDLISCLCLHLALYFTLLVLLLAAINPAYAERRLALVIGNNAYADNAKLYNAINDAELIATTLENQPLGFKVQLERDLDGGAFRKALKKFYAKVDGTTEIALIYFAGHGMQETEYGSRSHILPIDAPQLPDFENDTLSLDGVVRGLKKQRAKFNIVILDACRSNPFSPTRGIINLGKIPQNSEMLIAYSAAPGKIAHDGPRGTNGYYASALANQLKVPGLRINHVFSRVRKFVREATERFQKAQIPQYLADFDEEAPILHGIEGTPDSMRWTKLHQVNYLTIDHYRAFIIKNPESKYVEHANAAIQTLEMIQSIGPPFWLRQRIMLPFIATLLSLILLTGIWMMRRRNSAATGLHVSIADEPLGIVEPPKGKIGNMQLLPYLVDRKAQETRFISDVTMVKTGSDPSRPVLYVVHGHNDDRLLKLVSRFKDHTIPNNLGEGIARRPTREGRLMWPDLMNDTSPANLDAQLDQLFVGALLGRKDKSIENMHESLARSRRNYLVRCELGKETWEREGPIVIDRILERIAALPDHSDGTLIMFVICLEHNGPVQAIEKASGLSSGDQQSEHYGDALNRQIVKFVKAHGSGLHYCYLPQLDSVSAQDACEWAGLPEIEHFCEDSDDLRDEIVDLYEQQDRREAGVDNKRGIRMAHLARHLKKFLRAQKMEG